MITTANIVQIGADVRNYLKQPVNEETGEVIKRGDPRYVMSRGALLQFSSCPAKWLATEDADGDELGTKATEWGTLVDCLLLDEGRIEDRIAVYPETYPCESTARDPRTEKPWNNNATFCRAWKEKAESEGKLCVKVETFNQARLAVQRVKQDVRLATLLAEAEYQVWVAGMWKDRATGLSVPLKTLIDIVPSTLQEPMFAFYADSLADLKTSRNASPHAWEGVCYDGGYHIQAALALMLYNAVPGVNRREFFLHAISENEPPYQIGRRILGAEMMNQANIWLQSVLARYCQCLVSGNWPDYECLPESHGGWTPINPKPWREQQILETMPAFPESVTDQLHEFDTTP